MNRTIPWLAAAALLGSLTAQEAPPAKPDVATRLAEFQKRQQGIVAEWRQAVEAAQKATEELKREGKAVPATPMSPDFSALRLEVLEAAREYEGDDQGKLLVAAFHFSGSNEQYGEVLDLLLKDHAKGSAIAQLGPSLGYLDQIVGKEKAAAAYRHLEQHATDLRVRGWLAYAVHGKVIASAAVDSKEFAAAKATLLAAIEKAGDKHLKGMVESELVEKEQFAIGLTAPDIDGVDLDDVAFQLSDYRGKVVFVDFWGDW